MGKKGSDLTGQHINRWTVINEDRHDPKTRRWICRCDCGVTKSVKDYQLRHGYSISCGCHRKPWLFEDLTGKQFSHWKVLNKDPNSDSGDKWLCQCNCGNIQSIAIKSLIKETPICCYACRTQKIIKTRLKKSDLSGQCFGDWTVLYRDPESNTRWMCRCECGSISSVLTHELKFGKTKGCKLCKGKRISEVLETKRVSLLGQRFGKLLVIRYEGTRNQQAYWTCQCDCGNTVSVTSSRLTTGWTKSCGCLVREVFSAGEEKIAQLLSKSQISFEKEKKFDSCKISKRLLRFDFWVDNKYIIEYDGIQHFSDKQWETDVDNFQKRQKRDEFKNNWCFKNQIPIIRIPYTRYNSLCLEDLLLETSPFLLSIDKEVRKN